MPNLPVLKNLSKQRHSDKIASVHYMKKDAVTRQRHSKNCSKVSANLFKWNFLFSGFFPCKFVLPEFVMLISDSVSVFFLQIYSGVVLMQKCDCETFLVFLQTHLLLWSSVSGKFYIDLQKIRVCKKISFSAKFL